jgi:hypothetical protein
MPDVWDFADMHADEITRLFAARGAEWAEPTQPADARRRSVRRSPRRIRRCDDSAPWLRVWRTPGIDVDAKFNYNGRCAAFNLSRGDGWRPSWVSVIRDKVQR